MRTYLTAALGLCIAVTVSAQNQTFKVTLLGTAGPSLAMEHPETGTLVQAGNETLLFDCGRGVPERLNQLGFSNVNKVFLTHLHSDHTEGLPVLWMSGWNGRGSNNLSLYGPGTGPDQPTGTAGLAASLTAAYATNTHIRRDLVEMWNPAGIVIAAHEISEGVVYQNNGVLVSAFLVDHDPVSPALGYRIDYAGRSVVISGDTKPSANLVKYAQGVDLLIHEVFNAGPGSTTPTAVYHTLPEQAASIFLQTTPKLAVYFHLAPAAFDPTARTRAAGYAGPLQVGADLMSVTVANTVTVTPCDSTATPTLDAVTNQAYSTSLSVGDTLIFWGTGFSAKGGNALVFRQGANGTGAPMTLDETGAAYFWDNSTGQINAKLSAGITAGQWSVSVRNACGVTSSSIALTLR